jgi:hypothetical protein
MITIAARDLDPATLSMEPISNPAVRLLGPKPLQPSVYGMRLPLISCLFVRR